MDQRIQAEMADSNIPGVLIGVASRGRLVHMRPYGMANVELRVPVSDSTVFEIGSISKQFVATAIMLLAEEGRVGLDDGIHEYLPDLPSEWLGVTVRQLLTHTSGIPDYEEIQTYEAYRFRFTPEEIIRVAHSRPMDFAPGEKWVYNNSGLSLLSPMVHKATGQNIDQLLEGATRPTSPFTARDGASMLDVLFERATHIPVWVLSLGNAVVTMEELEAKMVKHGRRTKAIAIAYKHLPAVATEEKKRENREFLVIGWDPELVREGEAA